jgi:hypothetical protein
VPVEEADEAKGLSTDARADLARARSSSASSVSSKKPSGMHAPAPRQPKLGARQLIHATSCRCR